jgi:hypothetical protein
MSDAPSPPRPVFDAPADDVIRYRAVSGLAVAGLLMGLASPLALLGLPGWLVPAGGALLNGLALARIARAGPALIGRKAALAGLGLSLLFAAAAVSRWYVANRLLRNEAMRFAAVWFDALRRGNSQRAFQLTLDPAHRWPSGEDPRNFDRDNPRRHEQFQRYLRQPPVPTLLALGPKAQVRLCEAADLGQQDGHPWVQLTYAVTCDDPATSFFLTLTLDRFITAGRTDWRLLGVDSDLPPP